MVYRYGKWELPKGKLYQSEESTAAAIREVKEECNLKVKLLTKVYTTWHAYIKEGTRILKSSSLVCYDLPG